MKTQLFVLKPTSGIELASCVCSAGADPGFAKGWGAGGSGASFWAYLGQFRGLFLKNFMCTKVA